MSRRGHNCARRWWCSISNQIAVAVAKLNCLVGVLDSIYLLIVKNYLDHGARQNGVAINVSLYVAEV